jgi:hypothetical protein
LTLSGCGFISLARISINESITPEDTAFIKPGQTTLAEIIHTFGTPDEITGFDEGAVIAYHFRDVKYSRVNFGWPLQFWLPYSPDFILSGAGLGTDVFQVAFDANWIARHHSFAKHTRTNRYNPWLFRVR